MLPSGRMAVSEFSECAEPCGGPRFGGGDRMAQHTLEERDMATDRIDWKMGRSETSVQCDVCYERGSAAEMSFGGGIAVCSDACRRIAERRHEQNEPLWQHPPSPV